MVFIRRARGHGNSNDRDDVTEHVENALDRRAEDGEGTGTNTDRHLDGGRERIQREYHDKRALDVIQPAHGALALWHGGKLVGRTAGFNILAYFGGCRNSLKSNRRCARWERCLAAPSRVSASCTRR